MMDQPVPISPVTCLSSAIHAPVRLLLFLMMIGLCLSAGVMAQSANIAVGSPSGLPGAAVTVPVVFTPGAAGVSTVQFNLGFSSSLVHISTSSGPAATAAAKSTAGDAVSGGALRLLVYGINQKVVGSGIIANIQFSISPAAPPGPLPVTVTGIVAPDPLGNAVPITGTAGEVQVLAPADTTPPEINNVLSSNLSATGATVSWSTDEESDSQVEYGKTTGYGSSTVLNGSMVILHSQALTGLSADTLYHYRVKSKDAAGNQATSGDYTFTTKESTDPPQITQVAVSDITSKSAVISWFTDKAADSEVEYREPGEAPKLAALREPATAHSIMLNRLKRQTEYTFSVRSTDAGGRQSVVSGLSFTTAESGAPALALPRFSAVQSMLGSDTWSGIGLTNLDSSPAAVLFTAVEEDGNYTSGPDIDNPVTLDVKGKTQLSTVDSQVFGSGISHSGSNGHIQIESTNEDTRGFFYISGDSLIFKDGANLSDTQMKDFIFTEIQPGGYNKISIINNNPENSYITIDLVDMDGMIRNSTSKVIDGNGSLTADLFGDLFIGTEPDATDYVRVESSKGVQSYQVMRQGTGDFAMLEGQDLTIGKTVLYSPFYAFGGSYRTSLSLINLDSVPGMVTLRFVGEDGTPFGGSRTVEIPATGKLYIDDASFFTTLNPEVLNTGYIEATSDGIRMAGSTMIGDINRHSFSAALALVSSPQSSLFFGHVASDNAYFTRLSMLNPGPASANVELRLYDENGKLRETEYESISPEQSQSRLLTEYFTSLERRSQTSGYMRIISDEPIAAFAVFGTQDLSVLSAIPPQFVQNPGSETNPRRGRSRRTTR